MKRYVAFLRAVNLGSRRRVTSDELKESFEQAGFEDVACFRTSGNVVFGATAGSEPEIAKRIEDGLREALGFEVPVFLRSERELRAITEYEPFDPELVATSNGKLQVSLLGAKPTAGVRKRVLELATDEDRLAIEGRELYWLPNGGTQRPALDQKAIAELAGPATMRTKGTVEQIAAKYFR